MTNVNSYFTPARDVRVKVPVGACRFFASVKAIINEDEARQFIAEVSNEYRDATHNAWAYRIGIGNHVLVRSTDDGEPANTAGIPIEQAIDGAGVTNVVVVVTRYFGGVKLGIGGLIRAYRGAAAEGLFEASKVSIIALRKVFVEELNYNQIGNIIHHIESKNGEILDIRYGEKVTVVAKIMPDLVETIGVATRDATRGQAVLRVGEMLWQKAK